MLELRPSCELCGHLLPPDSDEARMCTYECTFCVSCATWELFGVCPNCTGELVARPRRPASKLINDPASTLTVRHDHDVASHQEQVRKRLLEDDLPIQLWTVAFVNQKVDDLTGYAAMGEEMEELASRQPGFVSVDSVGNGNGEAITVSRWSSIAALVSWRRVAAHQTAQEQGRSNWYESYRSDVARVDRVAQFDRRTTAL